MKKLLFALVFLSSFSLQAQVSNTFDRIFRQDGGPGLSPKKFTNTDSLLNRDNATKINSLSALIAPSPGFAYIAKVNNLTLVQPIYQFGPQSFTTGQNFTFSCSIIPTANVKQIDQIRTFWSNVSTPLDNVSGAGLNVASVKTLVVGTTAQQYTVSGNISASMASNTYPRIYVDIQAIDTSQPVQFTIYNIKLTVNDMPVNQTSGTGTGLYRTVSGDTFSAVSISQFGSSSSSGSTTVTAATSSTLSLENTEKIVGLGNSYKEFIGGLKDKAPLSVLSGLSEYNWINFSTGGRSNEVLANDITTGVKKFSSTYTFPMFKAKYAIISDNQNGKNTLAQNDSTYYANTQLLINTVRAYGVEPIIATEAGGWFATTRDGEQRNLKGLQALAYLNYCKFIDVVTKSRIFNATYNARFWKSSHPVTRTAWLDIDGIRKGLKQTLPRPRQSLKLFRVRGTTTVNTTADLLYRTIPERYTKWKEISIGHTALSEAQKVKYDTTSGLYDGSQTVNDEYLLLRGGTSVSFGTYALVDAVLPVYQPVGLSLVVSDTASTVQAFARKITSTGSSWVQLTGTKGVFTVPDNAGLTDYDRAAFLLTKSGGVNLSNVYLSWTSGTTKQTQFPVPDQAPKGAELLAQPYVGNSTQLSSWTVTGSVSATTAADNVLPSSTTGLVEVTPTATISQSFVAPISDDPTEVVIRVWARRWVPFFSQSANFTTAPITYETADVGTLQVNLSGTTGLSLSQYTDVVGLHWCEIEFRAILPPNSTTTQQIIKVFSKDVPLQIAKVSVRTLN